MPDVCSTTSVSRRNSKKALVEPRADCLPNTQALTRKLLTSDYYGTSAPSRRDRVLPVSPAEGVNVPVELRERHEVELRGLEPLASHMPCLTNPSGAVA